MTGRRPIAFLVALVAGSGCSSSGAPAGDGKSGSATVSGAITGNSWTSVSAAYWIGKPGAGSPPTIFFLLEAPTTCAAISLVNWDKIIGNEQVLEVGIKASTSGTYQIIKDASVSYLRGSYNPDADSGTVTIDAVTPATSLAGSFDLHFGADVLRGTFNAAFCPQGVEP